MSFESAVDACAADGAWPAMPKSAGELENAIKGTYAHIPSRS